MVIFLSLVSKTTTTKANTGNFLFQYGRFFPILNSIEVPLRRLPHRVNGTLRGLIQIYIAFDGLNRPTFPFDNGLQKFRRVQRGSHRVRTIFNQRGTFTLTLRGSNERRLFSRNDTNHKHPRPFTLNFIKRVLFTHALRDKRRHVFNVKFQQNNMVLNGEYNDSHGHLSLGGLQRQYFTLNIRIKFTFRHDTRANIGIFPATIGGIFTLYNGLLTTTLGCNDSDFMRVNEDGHTGRFTTSGKRRFLFTFYGSHGADLYGLHYKRSYIVIYCLNVISGTPRLQNGLRTLRGKGLQRRHHSGIDHHLFRVKDSMVTIYSQVNRRPLFMRNLNVVGNLLNDGTVGTINFPLWKDGIVRLQKLRNFLLFFREDAGNLQVFTDHLRNVYFNDFNGTFAFHLGSTATSLRGVVFFFLRHNGLPITLCRRVRH